MAKRKSADSKTAAILEYSKEHPNEGPSAIAAALSSRGIGVSAQYVSTIKSKFGVPGPRKRRGRRSSAESAPATTASVSKTRQSSKRSGQEVSYDSLVKAKEFVQSQGSVAEAKRVLDAYANLQ